MPLYQSPALVLRTMRLGEADRIVTFFTRKYGKLKAVAKGALKPKSRLSGRVEPFLHVNIIVFGKEKADLFRLNSIDIVEAFMPMRERLERLSRAYVSAELVDICQKEGDVNQAGFDLLLSFLRALNQDMPKDRQELLLRFFELKFLSSIGLEPALEKCVICGAEPKGDKTGFHPAQGGVVCSRCLPGSPSAIIATMGAIKLLAKGMSLPNERLSRLSASPKLILEVDRLVNRFISAHVARDIRSERFLKL
ncbi:DNA recombination and repair protein RecO [hydrothermal vent metagenome]|uniref:DNA repair protein RecO n=1 Tax=hydrothermal vent metagenome TaxID=652676 RepID=A0A3B1CE86_9ZZZZ